MMLDSSRYDKWSGGGGGGGYNNAAGGRERDRERAAVARAQQTSVATTEPDANTLFRAPVRITGSNDKISQQIQSKMGDYHMAQSLIDDPRDSIGIYPEPPSPAPCPPRNSSEFKKPHYNCLPNGRTHSGSSAGANRIPTPHKNVDSSHPPAQPATQHQRVPQPHQHPLQQQQQQPLQPLQRVPNGTQHHQNHIDLNEPIENILKEMRLKKMLTEISTPRNELENKFVYNTGDLNKLNENTTLCSSSEVKKTTPPCKQKGIDNRVTTTEQISSPDVVSTHLPPALTDEVESILSPLSSTSVSDSSDSDSDSSSSSDAKAVPIPSPVAAPAPPPQVDQHTSWGLHNFVVKDSLAPQKKEDQYDTTKDAESVLAEVKDTPPQLSEFSDSDDDSSAPETAAAKRRAPPSTASSDDERPTSDPRRTSSSSSASPRVQPAPRQDPERRNKRGRPRKTRPEMEERVRKPGRPSEDERPKKPRGRPRKVKPSSPPGRPPDDLSPSASGESDAEPEPRRVAPVVPHVDKKINILRNVFTKKSEDGLGKGGAKGGKGGKGKAQVIVEASAPESGADDDHDRRSRDERRTKTPLQSPKMLKVETESPRRPREEPPRIKVEAASPKRTPYLSESPFRAKSDPISPVKTKLEPASPLRLKVQHESPRRPKLETESPRRARVELESPRRPKVELESPRRPKVEPESILRREEATRLQEPETKDPLVARLESEGVRVRIPLSRLRPETNAMLARKRSASVSSSGCDKRPRYYSYLTAGNEREERDHAHYLEQAKRLRAAADSEEGVARVILYLESVLCFVLTGRVLEMELDSKKAFMMYRQTIECIKSIHAMPARYRTSASHNKLEILSLRVQALLYLRMFKMYKPEIKEHNRVVLEYENSTSSPTPSPCGSVGSVGSGGSSGYGTNVPTHALVQLTKYYRCLYLAHELWDKADSLSRLKHNIDLFLTVDQIIGQLTLQSTFRHLVAYVSYAISIIKAESKD